MRVPYLVENTHRGFVLVGRVGAWLCALSLTQDALAFVARSASSARLYTYRVYFLRFMCFAAERFERPARPAPSIPAEPSKDAST